MISEEEIAEGRKLHHAATNPTGLRESVTARANLLDYAVNNLTVLLDAAEAPILNYTKLLMVVEARRDAALAEVARFKECNWTIQEIADLPLPMKLRNDIRKALKND